MVSIYMIQSKLKFRNVRLFWKLFQLPDGLDCQKTYSVCKQVCYSQVNALTPCYSLCIQNSQALQLKSKSFTAW